MEKYTDFSKKLGRGSFGCVKLIQRNADKKLLAMKMIDLTTEEAANNAYNEPNMLERLQHPNIVQFYETFVVKDVLYLVMEYCEEGDLQSKVKETRVKGEYFCEDQIIEWFVQICLALKQLHDHHIIHRDIKIHNTFLTSNGLVKLGDFGISKQLESTGDLGTTWLGTPFYVSPEMLSHSISSFKSDIWMLGCLLHELCSLEKPFPGENIHLIITKIMHEDYTAVPDHYSPFLRDLISKLLDKNPEKRLSIQEILELPEILDEIDKLRLKFPEAYLNEPFINVLRVQPTQESRPSPVNIASKRWVSEPDVLPTPISQKSSATITDNGKPVMNLSGLLNSWEHSDAVPGFPNSAKCSENRRSNLTSTSITPPNDQAKPPLPEVKRRANNIRALVEQKKANLSPSNAEKTTTTPSNPTFATTSVTPPSQSSRQPNLLQPVRMQTAPPEMAESQSESRKEAFELDLRGKENKVGCEEDKQRDPSPPNNMKALEGTKKHWNLSINIPGGPEQGEAQSVPVKKEKKEKPKPAKLISPMNDGLDANSIPTTKVGAQKSFTFSQYVFDKKSPVSPNRTFWVTQFLKQKLGDEKYEKVRELIENSSNPSHLLKEQPEKVLEIIGEDKQDCVVMLNFLISQNANSVTPTGEKGPLDKYSYMRVFEVSKSTRSYKSPNSANPFLKNIFPCATEPDFGGSRENIDELKSSRRILSDIPKQKEKEIVGSLQCLIEDDKETN